MCVCFITSTSTCSLCLVTVAKVSVRSISIKGTLYKPVLWLRLIRLQLITVVQSDVESLLLSTQVTWWVSLGSDLPGHLPRCFTSICSCFIHDASRTRQGLSYEFPSVAQTMFSLWRLQMMLQMHLGRKSQMSHDGFSQKKKISILSSTCFRSTAHISSKSLAGEHLETSEWRHRSLIFHRLWVCWYKELILILWKNFLRHVADTIQSRINISKLIQSLTPTDSFQFDMEITTFFLVWIKMTSSLDSDRICLK